MISSHRVSWMVAIVSSCGIFLGTSTAQAIPEKVIRQLVQQAEGYERNHDWEEARQIYEALLSQKEYGSQIRERYQNVLRHCWQARRHQDESYRKEVLSVDYGQAMKIHRIISKALMEGSVDKKKITPTKLFRKGLEELDAALADPRFIDEYIPANKRGEVETFRAMLKKKWGNAKGLSNDGVVAHINDIAMAAGALLDINATVVAMEFACGACYAIDEYTAYLTPNQLHQLARSLSRSEAVGVGLILKISENRIVVADITVGGPADLQKRMETKINIGDQIISVDKKPVVDLPLLTVKELLEGTVGSMVEIEVLAPGEESSRTIPLTRDRAVVPSVVAYMVPRTDYGYLKINSFTETTAEDVDNALAELSRDNMKALILDLRENGGGVFKSSIETAQRFLKSGIITSTLNQNPNDNRMYSAKNPDAFSLPIVLLVDGDTASAAEVLAGALKDNNRAFLIGQRTFGKGCTQCLLRLPNAVGGVPTGGMKLTVARFYSPKGESYSERGVIPDSFIEDRMPMSESGRDSYIDRAIEELNRMTAMQK